ncbi:hypothetical protein BURK2_01247 [Burkholderiales bacterium]|nr:MAG: hypothetical protein F9K47_07030 [Burkholderiales bacterium]CAG0970406.1 hypothetical protein BURK2_01247 [Burkholderiales bacterium]
MSKRQVRSWILFAVLLGLGPGIAVPVGAAPLLDSSFGTLGTVRVGGASKGKDEGPTAVTVQRDGRIVLAGSSTDAGWRTHGSFLLRLGDDGRPDASFGQNGYVSPATSGLGEIGVAQLAETSDGALLLGGVQWGAAGNTSRYTYHLRRFTRSGIPDPSFGTQGKVSIPLAESDEARFVLQADGGILVVFDPGPRSAVPAGNPFRLVLVRITASGGVDPSFGSSGQLMLSGLPADVRLRALIAEPDGGFTALASAFQPALVQGAPSVLVRVRANGVLDTAFGIGGVVSGRDLDWANSQAQALVRDDLGRYLLLGDGQNQGPGQFGKHLWRLTSGGQLDEVFGDHGGTPIANPWAGARWNLGRIGNAPVVARTGGVHDGVGAGVAFEKFLESGARDTQFGSGGIAYHLHLLGYNQLFGLGMLAGLDGKLLFVTSACDCEYDVYPSAFIDLAALRLDGAGLADQGFGRGDGWAIWNTPSFTEEYVEALLEDPAGRILLVGHTLVPRSSAFFLARLQTEGGADLSFGTAGRVAPDAHARCSGAARAVVSATGMISVAAASGVGTHCTVGSTVAFRLDASGAAAPNFTPMLFPAPRADFLPALALRPDGRLLFGTTTLEQRLPDGTPDLSFGQSGRVALPSTIETRWSELIVLPDGGAIWGFAEATEVRIFKLLPSGALDERFGIAGMFSRSLADAGSAQTLEYGHFQLLIRPDGSFLLMTHANPSASTNAPEASLRLIHLSARGDLLADTAMFSALVPVNGAKSRAAALPDGSVLIARRLSAAAESVVSMFRLGPDLSLDPSFSGASGVVLEGLKEIDSLLIDREGRAVLGGQDRTSAVVQRYVLTAPPAPVSVVEFHNTLLGHYFITGGAGEIAAIDAGGAGPGWSRTGLGFKAYAPETGIAPGALPVCRFYGTPGVGPNSHFYTVDSTECENVKHDPGWTYEGLAFFIFPPNNGSCAAGQVPVYRAYNLRFAQNDSNHRYTTDSATYVQMQAQGWAGEGVKFCGIQ